MRWSRCIQLTVRVVASSAHAAFFKAAGYFGIKVHNIPVNPKTRRADVTAMKNAM